MEAASSRHAPVLARWGHFPDAVRDGQRSFVPFIGLATAVLVPSTAWRWSASFPADFEPRRYFPDVDASSVPEAWPISYDDLAPFSYQQAETLYRVRGSPDDLRPDCSALLLPAPRSVP